MCRGVAQGVRDCGGSGVRSSVKLYQRREHCFPGGHPAGGKGSAVGLLGPVSVYCEWVRQHVSTASSISV